MLLFCGPDRPQNGLAVRTFGHVLPGRPPLFFGQPPPFVADLAVVSELGNDLAIGHGKSASQNRFVLAAISSFSKRKQTAMSIPNATPPQIPAAQVMNIFSCEIRIVFGFLRSGRCEKMVLSYPPRQSRVRLCSEAKPSDGTVARRYTSPSPRNVIEFGTASLPLARRLSRHPGLTSNPKL